MKRRIKTSSMIKFGYIMLALNMTGAGIFWLLHDHARVVMFMAGSMLWIIGLLIWYKIAEQEHEDK